jgi:hypothetical protein
MGAAVASSLRTVRNASVVMLSWHPDVTRLEIV